MTRIVLQGPGLTPSIAEEIASAMGGNLDNRKGFFAVTTDAVTSKESLQALGNKYQVDVNALPDEFDPAQARLFVTDMDSTFINIECIDEIADMLGIKPQVAAITEAAMRGDLDFPAALRRRVKLLTGLSVDALDRVYQERLRLNPGGEALLNGLRRRGIAVALVSGGFTFFTEKLHSRYQLDFSRANSLEIRNGKLTGELHGAIVDAQGKAEFLLECCQHMKIQASQVIAAGDGANDLTMLGLAGLSVAYHAKPKVRAATHVAIDRCGLEGLLGLLGIDH